MPSPKMGVAPSPSCRVISSGLFELRSSLAAIDADSALAIPALSFASSLASAVDIRPCTLSTCPPSPEGASSCSVRSAGSDCRRKSATAGGVFSALSAASTAGAPSVIFSVPFPDSSGFGGAKR